jgi:hypothetical protein
MDSHITPDRLFSLGTGYRCAKVLLCAVELDVFTALDGRPRVAADLARVLGIHNRSACDFFDALVALGLLQRDTDGRYANTAEASLYLDQNKTTYPVARPGKLLRDGFRRQQTACCHGVYKRTKAFRIIINRREMFGGRAANLRLAGSQCIT